MRLLLSFFFACISTFFLSQGIHFKKLLEQEPDRLIVTCIPKNEQHSQLLFDEKIGIKYSTKNFIFINATPRWLQQKIDSKALSQFYFEFAPPHLLSDTSLVVHRVDSVHRGLGELTRPYTGKGVLIGLVDSGLDYRHPDFKDANGNTRVLRYWDQNISGTPPQPYGYGAEFDSVTLNNTTIPSDLANSIHGSSVTGMACSNGLANGTNIGMAPDSKIIMVHTNFNNPNWTLTVADACDYIFKIADQYGLPAVVNLSVGTYLGSHDGEDPASQQIENLLDEKSGRVVVCAAGNSGQFGKYHLRGNASLDTSFTWFKNNPNSAVGVNKIYFDFWMQNEEAANLFYGFGADHPSDYKLRGKTELMQINSNLGSFPHRDTIYGKLGHILATVEVYRQIQGQSLHMEVLFNRIDSTNYLFRFQTFGTAQFDLWSGTTLNLNEIVEDIPSPSIMPKIVDYLLPDSDQSIVSSWNCSEKVVSVGNIRNRRSHVTKNQTVFGIGGNSAVVGELSFTSSKGPTRINHIKPDVTATGEMSLGAGSLAFLSNPANNNSIDSGGWHIRNGGTSMASPVVAGIAALFLEKCPSGDYQTFIDLLHNHSFKDAFTGSVPNNSYGYGKANAMGVLNNATPLPAPIISQNGIVLISTEQDNYQWLKDGSELQNETSQSLAIFPPNAGYQVYTLDNSGCYNYSKIFDSKLSLKENQPNIPTISPNPVQSFLTLPEKYKLIDFQIFDNQGKEVFVEREGLMLDVRALSEGFYIIQLKDENKVQTFKFIRSH